MITALTAHLESQNTTRQLDSIKLLCDNTTGECVIYSPSPFNLSCSYLVSCKSPSGKKSKYVCLMLPVVGQHSLLVFNNEQNIGCIETSK